MSADPPYAARVAARIAARAADPLADIVARDANPKLNTIGTLIAEQDRRYLLGLLREARAAIRRSEAALYSVGAADTSEAFSLNSAILAKLAALDEPVHPRIVRVYDHADDPAF